MLMYSHTVLLGIVIVVVSVALSVAGLWVTRRLVKPEQLKRHHDIAGYILAIVGVIYGVLQAFVVFVVWSQYEDARSAVEAEASSASDLYHLAHGFAPAVQVRLRADLHAYIEDTVTYEWPAMAQGKSARESERSLDRLWSDYSSLSPATSRETVIYQESVERLNDMGNARKQRLLASRTGIPGVLWFVLIFGGVTTVAFTYFFGAESGSAQAAMVALLTADIALVLWVIAALAYPFTGDIGIKPQAFQTAKHRFATIERHEAAPDVK